MMNLIGMLRICTYNIKLDRALDSMELLKINLKNGLHIPGS